MHSIHLLEIQYIEFLQQFRSYWLDNFFIFLNFFDRQEFLFILVPIIWVGFSWKTGARLLYVLLLNPYVNYFLKTYFQQPRPFHINQSLEVLHVNSYGFPSGAAQTTFLLSGILLTSWKSKWAWVVAINYFFWVCLARIYLGVHFPSDLVGGWIVGAGLLLLYLFIFPKIESYLNEKPLWASFAISQCIPLALLIFFHTDYPLKLSCVAMGAGLGLFLSLKRNIFLDYPKRIQEGCLRGLIGIIGTFVSYGLYELLPIHNHTIKLALQFLSIGLWVSFGANFLYRKLILGKVRGLEC